MKYKLKTLIALSMMALTYGLNHSGSHVMAWFAMVGVMFSLVVLIIESDK